MCLENPLITNNIFKERVSGRDRSWRGANSLSTLTVVLKARDGPGLSGREHLLVSSGQRIFPCSCQTHRSRGSYSRPSADTGAKDWLGN